MGLLSEILRRGDRRTKGASEGKNKDKQRRSCGQDLRYSPSERQKQSRLLSSLLINSLLTAVPFLLTSPNSFRYKITSIFVVCKYICFEKQKNYKQITSLHCYNKFSPFPTFRKSSTIQKVNKIVNKFLYSPYH